MAKNISVSVTSNLSEYFTAASAAIPVAGAQALNEEVQLMFRQSQIEIPVLTGTAKNSGVMVPALPGPIFEASFGYGGAASAYVKRLNDDRSLNHPNGGKAGFVDDPVQARLPMLQASLTARLERALKR